MKVLVINEPFVKGFCRTQRWAARTRGRVVRAPDWLAYATAVLEKEGIGEAIVNKLELKPKKKDLKSWEKIIEDIKNPKYEVTIGMTGKYTDLKDAYISITEALVHAGAQLGVKTKVKWIETTSLENGKTKVEEELKGIDGVIVPHGFGSRGVEGKIMCLRYVRENKIPYLGLCYGFQMAVIEYARNVCGLKNANTTEANPKTSYPVIDILPSQKGIKGLGGTMRLGSQEITLKKGTIVSKIYNNKEKVKERFRHRYEVNPKYISMLTKYGLTFSGTDKSGKIMQFLELPDHPFFIGTQSHPEYKSRLERPSPPYVAFLKAVLKEKLNK